MDELFPIASGVMIGAVLGCLRPARRLSAGTVLAMAFGVASTVRSGEFLVSWAFLLVDVPLVAVCAAVSLVSVQRLRRDVSAR